MVESHSERYFKLLVAFQKSPPQPPSQVIGSVRPRVAFSRFRESPVC
jgi:hypothetical protein